MNYQFRQMGGQQRVHSAGRARQVHLRVDCGDKQRTWKEYGNGTMAHYHKLI